ncbi:MAG: hypothetical protein ACYC0X_21875 [Pirellulaceae bacterium]
MNVTRRQLIKWGLIAYLSVIVGPPSMACAYWVVKSFHLTGIEKYEAELEGFSGAKKVISRKLAGAVTAAIGLFFVLGCPASVGFGLFLAVVALTTEPTQASSCPGGSRDSRRPAARREPIDHPLIIDEPPLPPPPPRRRS